MAGAGAGGGVGHGQGGIISMDCGRDRLPFKGKVYDTVKLIMFAQPYCCKIEQVAELSFLSGHFGVRSVTAVTLWQSVCKTLTPPWDNDFSVKQSPYGLPQLGLRGL